MFVLSRDRNNATINFADCPSAELEDMALSASLFHVQDSPTVIAYCPES